MKKIVTIFMVLLITLLSSCTENKENKNPKNIIKIEEKKENKEEKKEVSLKDIETKIKEHLWEGYVSTENMPEDFIKELIKIDKNDVEEIIVKTPLMSTYVDTFIAIKAKKDKVLELETSLKNYKKYLLEEAFAYPSNLAKIQASEVIRHWDYVFFILLGKFDTRENITDTEALEFAKNEVKQIKDIIETFFK